MTAQILNAKCICSSFCDVALPWICGSKLKHRFPSKELRERLGIDNIALVLQQNRLRWYGNVLRKEDDDWVKRCMEYEVEGPRHRGRPKRTWTEFVEKDCKLNKEDAINHSKWRKDVKRLRVCALQFHNSEIPVWTGRRT